MIEPSALKCGVLITRRTTIRGQIVSDYFKVCFFMANIAVFNQKGGVGKTTTSLNVVAALARLEGKRVLAIDVDPQANLSSALGQKQPLADQSIFGFFTNVASLAGLMKPVADRIDLITGHLEVAKLDSLLGKSYGAITRLVVALKALQTGHSDVVCDCSPVLSVPTLNALFAADYVLIPVSADHLSVLGAQQVERTLGVLGPVMRREIPRKYVITRFNAANSVCWDVERKLRDLFNDHLCYTRIRESAALGESPVHGQDVFRYAPMSNGAGDYENLVKELKSYGWF
jgi:chromosome partitioning protein